MRQISLLIILIVLVAPVPVGAQKTTPWGDPDLQGIWNNGTPTPLERPRALGGKAFFTSAEAAEFERTHIERLNNLVGPRARLQADLTETWLEPGKVPPSRRTSLIVDPPDGRIPYTAEGQKRYDATPNAERQLTEELPANGPEDRPLTERCISINSAHIPNPFNNNNHHIFQTPGYVAILSEDPPDVRIIPLDKRPHVRPTIRQWLGDSRGRWEGQTLVVETTNFNGRPDFFGATSALGLVERFTRLGANTIKYEVRITDPATYTRPWAVALVLRKPAGPIYEVACHEGNYGLVGILAGARAEEKK